MKRMTINQLKKKKTNQLKKAKDTKRHFTEQEQNTQKTSKIMKKKVYLHQ